MWGLLVFMSDSTLQIRVAFQGELGAFSTDAARQLLGDEIQLVPCETFDLMFAAVEAKDADYCLAPLENSLFGSVYQNYDLLLKHDFQIVGETTLRIVHNLIVAPEMNREDVRLVYSHPVALGQCRNFLHDNLTMKPIVAYDTAGSVKMIMESREAGAAAIASASAAEVYGAKVIVPGIEDDPQNFTRFSLLARAEEAAAHPPPEIESAKTSIVFALENKTGSLYRAMAVFALRDLDLTKIESRPLIGRPWEYSFYLDFTGHTAEPRVQNALAHLAEFAANVKVLGCYKAATNS
jgi:prephenate dehydratase